MTVATLNMVRFDRRLRASLQAQLYRQIRELIISGQLRPGLRIPSSRDLVGMLGVSRNTIVYALDRLVAEGYLISRIGSGIYVANLPTRATISVAVKTSNSATKSARVSRMATRLLTENISPEYPSNKVRPFRPCQPAVEYFPIRSWNRARSYALRAEPREIFGEGEAAGLARLRRALAGYLRDARGVRCTAEQIVITAGTQQALSLIASLLLDAGDPVWIEDPGYLGARAVFRSWGARLIAVPIDSDGLSISDRLTELPRLIYCTPSRQFPLGTTMTINRRLALLEFARQNDVWIVEDDYDSEFRYVDRPLPSLQGLTGNGNVIYTGSFSKVLFPSLRLGYLVLPEGLVELFRKAKEIADASSPTIDQATVAVFIEEGFFSTHVRRMRSVYRERLEIFLNEARRCLNGFLTFPSIEAGMDATGWLERGMDDLQVSKQLMAAGVVAPPLSTYSIGPCPPGLVFGFTAFSPAQIRSGIRVITNITQKA